MKLTVLTDNNTYIDQYFLAEPGLSFFIEDEETKILFDCGYSDVFWRNAGRMGIDLLFLDYLVISHGHMDHTWGMDSLIREYNLAILQGRLHQKPEVLAHPKAFDSILLDGIGEIGSLISENKLKKQFKLKSSDSPVKLTKHLIFLGEIPRLNNFESLTPIGKKEGDNKGDFLLDDTALVYSTADGLVIITGCSHAGVCNIIDYAIKVCEDHRVIDVIGGLHLLDPCEKQLQGTVDYIKQLGLKQLHACHCTDLKSKIALASVAPLKEVGVGLTLEYKNTIS